MRMWEIKQSATAPKTVDIYLYSAIEGDSYDWWTGETIKSETSANTFKETLENIGEFDNINLYINSLGGSVLEGVAIYNQLKRTNAYITAYIDGFACSIASVIAMAADKVVMPKNTVMMIHNAWTRATGNASQLRKTADDLDKMNEVGKNAYLEKSGGKIDSEKLTELMDAETYLTADECIAYGFADEYADYNTDIEKAKAMLKEAEDSGMKNYASRLEKICAMADVSQLDNKPKAEFKEKAIEMFSGFLNIRK